MKERIHRLGQWLLDVLKAFLASPKITLVLLAMLGTATGTHFIPDKPVEIPPEAKEKAAELQIKLIDEIALPPKPMAETVTVTYEPHTHDEFLTKEEWKAFILIHH